MKQLLLLSLAILVAIAGCKTTKTGATALSASVQDTITDESAPKLMRDKELYNAVKEQVPIDTAWLAKDTLHLFTKKILGCDAGNFRLFWSGAMAKSLPPQASVKLFQQVDAECKEKHYFHLTYNVKSLKIKNDTSSTAPRADSVVLKATILNVGGYKSAVKYQY